MNTSVRKIAQTTETQFLGISRVREPDSTIMADAVARTHFSTVTICW
jgi:hypothetical protein